MNKRSVCNEFAKEHGIAYDRISGHQLDAIYWLEHSQMILTTACIAESHRLEMDPSWGLIQSMLDRVYGHAAGSIILQVTELFASSEALARTAVESAVNVLYVLNSTDRFGRLLEYFASYISEERKQNQKWANASTQLNELDRLLQKRGLTKKANALDKSESFLSNLVRPLNKIYPANASWPNAFERFKELGRESDYRTIYAAMSSQVHNDAEDLLNKFVIYLISDVASDAGEPNSKIMLADETVTFSRMLVLIGVQYYLEACHRYAQCFGLSNILNELQDGVTALSKLATKQALKYL